MRIDVISPSELDSQACAKWLELQRSNPALGSPFFCPDFTLAVAAVRSDVRIAVLQTGSEVVGFFPFQRRWSMGSPVGSYFSDHHGVIAAPDTRFEWSQLLRAAKLAYWRFDHLAAGQAPGSDCAQMTSPRMDLSQGLAAYKKRRQDNGARSFEEYERKARKLARTMGPLRFESHTNDQRVFEEVIRLKTEQCQRTGVGNVFRECWTRSLLEHIRAVQQPHFAGRLSALYAGDTLVAAHMGMCSEQVWHWWFPVYDRSYAKLSPGTQLLRLTAEEAAKQNLPFLDLGKGTEAYKQIFADSHLPLVEGWVSSPSPMTVLLGAPKMERWLRTSKVLKPLRTTLRQTISRFKRKASSVEIQ